MDKKYRRNTGIYTSSGTRTRYQMPLEYEIQPDNNLMIIRVIESFSVDEFEKMMHAILYDPAFLPGMNALWDVRRGTLRKLSGNDMHMISEYINTYQSQRGTGYKVALVVSNELDVGLSRLYEIISEQLPNQCREFRDYGQAQAWLDA